MLVCWCHLAEEEFNYSGSSLHRRSVCLPVTVYAWQKELRHGQSDSLVYSCQIALRTVWLQIRALLSGCSKLQCIDILEHNAQLANTEVNG